MDRRKFMKWFGLAPALPVAVKAAEAFAETAKRIDVVPGYVPHTPISAQIIDESALAPGPDDGRYWTTCSTACTFQMSTLRELGMWEWKK